MNTNESKKIVSIQEIADASLREATLLRMAEEICSLQLEYETRCIDQDAKFAALRREITDSLILKDGKYYRESEVTDLFNSDPRVIKGLKSRAEKKAELELLKMKFSVLNK